MQAQIRSNKNVYNTLYYHELKLRRGVAEFIGAGNFIKEVGDLRFEDKLFQLQRLTSLNEAVTNRIFHISLTFDVAERLTNKQMTGLADEFLLRMKLAHQPYLVYRHHDALHPHMHLVLPAVQKDGISVHLTPTDFYQINTITRALGLEHRLIQSPTRDERREQQTLKIKYGEMSLRPAISNVLHKVLPLYNYRDLEGLNAVLRLYNMQAHRGKEDSDLYQRRGLLFRVLDENGKPLVAQLFKASSFDGNSTLDRLEGRMAENLKNESRQQHRQRVTTLVQWHINKKNMDMPGLQKALQREQISMVWMDDKPRQAQKLFYVDHSTRTVFSGHELGNGYDALTLRQRLPEQAQQQTQGQQQELKQQQRHRLRHLL